MNDDLTDNTADQPGAWSREHWHEKVKVPADADGHLMWHWDDIVPPEMFAAWARSWNDELAAKSGAGVRATSTPGTDDDLMAAALQEREQILAGDVSGETCGETACAPSKQQAPTWVLDDADELP